MKRVATHSPVLAVAAAACCALAQALVPATASAAPFCTRYAAPAPAGSPAGSGTVDKPYGSVQQLVNAMAPGDVGCLFPGVYGETVSVLNRPGTVDQPFIVESEDPHNPATISAAADSQTLSVVYIGPSATHFQFSGVNVHALPNVGTPAITIAGDSNAVDGADITNGGNGTCVQIGPSADRRATNAQLDGDAIHSCGNPSGGHADGAGISYADGTRITNSYFYGSPRHGITMYPDAQHSEIAHNVIDRQRNGMGDGEGVQFGTDSSGVPPSSNNVVEANLISDNESVNIGFNWNDGHGPIGSGNDVRGNCISNTGNTNGEFQTDPSTHQPVGYTQEQNTVGSDPQYTSRDTPPAGYALAPSTPCPGLGPLATVKADLFPGVLSDPEKQPVLTALVNGEVNPHLQAAAVHFELGLPGGGPVLQTLPVQQIDPLGMPVSVFGQFSVRLKPNSTYVYRLVADAPAGSASSDPVTFQSGPAPKLAPPIPTVAYATKFTKSGVALSGLTVRNLSSGMTTTLRCTGSRCPFSERTGLRNLGLLRRAFPAGTTIRIELDPEFPVGQYLGRVITLTIHRVNRRHPQRSIQRTDACVRFFGKPIPCLRAVAQFVSFPGFLRFSRFVAIRVPAGATLDYRCVHGKCPRFPGCRTVAKGFKDIPLLTRAARRKVKPGVVFDVRVLKPDTSGLVNRFTIRRRRGGVVAVQRSFFVRPSVQHSGSCADA